MATGEELADNRVGYIAAKARQAEALAECDAAIQTELDQAQEALVLGMTAIANASVVSVERREELDAAIPEFAMDVVSGIFRAVQLEIAKPSHIEKAADQAYEAARGKSRDDRMRADIEYQVSKMFSGNRSSR